MFIFSFTLKADDTVTLAEKAHLANINALLIFTSQDGINSGHYHFSEVGVDMDVYHLPFKYHFKSDTSLSYFVVGNVGYSSTYVSHDIVIPPDSPLNYDNYMRTYTAGLGGGLSYEISDDLHVLAGVEFIYSRSGASVREPDSDIGREIEDIFNKNYNDNTTYKYFSSIEYRPTHYKYKPYTSLSFKYYQTSSTFDFDLSSAFSTHSNVTTFALGLETPKLLAYEKNYLTIEGYTRANYLYGDVERAVKFKYYGSVGAVAYLYTPDISWAQRFFIETNTIRSSGLEGYNLSLGFSVDF
ncbi:MAG: hypothetical protein GQ570_14515 [Helicobacteraceae bacterium]|nr:hypothetical protein [Helicobacteraceae bacterium]